MDKEHFLVYTIYSYTCTEKEAESGHRTRNPAITSSKVAICSRIWNHHELFNSLSEFYVIADKPRLLQHIIAKNIMWLVVFRCTLHFHFL